jgi:hypothetical protein
MAKESISQVYFKVAPVGIYTSGKGSSAAGLAASVGLTPGRIYLEGGAMVLADGGIVCIDGIQDATSRSRGDSRRNKRPVSPRLRNHDGAQLTISVLAAANQSLDDTTISRAHPRIST